MDSRAEFASHPEDPISHGDYYPANPRRLHKEVPPPPVPRSVGNWRERDYVAAHSTIEALVRAQYQCEGEPMGDIHRLLGHEPKPLWAKFDRMRLPQVHCGSARAKKSTKRCCDQKQDCKGVLRSREPRGANRPHSACDAPPRRIPPVALISKGGEQGHRAPKEDVVTFEDIAEPERPHSPPRSPSNGQINHAGQSSEKLSDMGIDSEVAPYLHDRLSQLATQHQSAEQPTCVWVIVECCMDCANHGPSLRHDERAYLARFLQLKDAIQRMFPVGVSVELLVPRVAYSDGCCADVVPGYLAAEAFGAGYGANRQTPQPNRSQYTPVWRPSSPSPGPCPASETRIKSGQTERLLAGRTRIGSFEVYLCCTSSLILEGGTSLLTVAMPKRPGSALQNSLAVARTAAVPTTQRRDDFKGMCLASKLKSRSWPPADVVLSKLLAAMPAVRFQVRVHTELESPVAGIQISTFQAQATGPKPPRPSSARTKYEEIRMMPGTTCVPQESGKTDRDGIFILHLPVYRTVRIQACHSIYLKEEVKELQVTPWENEVTFIADTVVQLWEMEEENDLVVYCSSPRSAATPPAGLLPFHGSVELFNGSVADFGNFEHPSASSYLRGRRDILPEIDLLHCDGWRSGNASSKVVVHGTGRYVELGRLQVPKVEVSLVTQCCKCAIHGARISMDGGLIGITSLENNKTITCGARRGDHLIRAEHFLVPDGVKCPFSVSGSTSTGLEVPFALEKLRFICVAQKRSDQAGDSGSDSADLWLVGGDLASWRSSPHGPAHDAAVWLWDGELRHRPSARWHFSDSMESVRVQGGVMNNTDFEAVCKEEDESSNCIFSTALKFPSSHDEWKPTLHPAGFSPDCAVAHLASSPCAPAIWIAQLSNSSRCKSGDYKRDLGASANSLSSSWGSKALPRIVMRTKCCGAGFEGAQISIDGSDAGTTDALGRLQPGTYGRTSSSPKAQTSKSPRGDTDSRPGSVCSTPRRWEKLYGNFASELTHIKIAGVPASLLPGNTHEYVVHSAHASKTDISLDVACCFWFYWLPPEVEDTTYDDDSDMQDYESHPEGTVWICASSEHVPEEALPLAGTVECQGSRIELDGQSIGPWPLCPIPDSRESTCVLSDLVIRPSPIEGYTLRAREPSPLKERCSEMGGCELCRLAACPVVVGYLQARDAQKS